MLILRRIENTVGRPKSYDQDQVIKKVMMQFWQSGFAETSIADLENTTSLNRYSLYNGFGDKEVLFEKALDYYQEHIITKLLAPLSEKPTSLDSIINFFINLNASLKSRYGVFGCLIQNSQREGISHSEFVKQQGIAVWKQQYTLFSTCLDDPACNLPFTKEDAIQLLLAQTQAQISLARAKAPHDVLNKQCQAIKSLITTWRTQNKS